MEESIKEGRWQLQGDSGCFEYCSRLVREIEIRHQYGGYGTCDKDGNEYRESTIIQTYSQNEVRRNFLSILQSVVEFS